MDAEKVLRDKLQMATDRAQAIAEQRNEATDRAALLYAQVFALHRRVQELERENTALRAQIMAPKSEETPSPDGRSINGAAEAESAATH